MVFHENVQHFGIRPLRPGDRLDIVGQEFADPALLRLRRDLELAAVDQVPTRLFHEPLRTSAGTDQTLLAIVVVAINGSR